MANDYWLSDEQWLSIEPLIPTRCRSVKSGRNREVISRICTCSTSAVADGTVQRYTVRPRRSIIASIAGPRRASGRACCND
jgi:transposase